MALLLAIFALLLLTVLMAGIALQAQIEAAQARVHLDEVRARLAAEAGIYRAVAGLMAPETVRWVADGRSYGWQLAGFDLDIEVQDEAGKFDLNVAGIGPLTALFEPVSRDRGEARALAAAVLDWRDADDEALPEGAEAEAYRLAGKSYLPRNQPFESVHEVQQVLGMDYGRLRAIEHLVTIDSGRSEPVLAVAPEGVWRLIPGLDSATLDALLAQRHALASGGSLTLPDGRRVEAAPPPRAVTLTITVRRGELPVGGLAVTLRLATAGPLQRPFQVLRWRDRP